MRNNAIMAVVWYLYPFSLNEIPISARSFRSHTTASCLYSVAAKENEMLNDFLLIQVNNPDLREISPSLEWPMLEIFLSSDFYAHRYLDSLCLAIFTLVCRYQRQDNTLRCSLMFGLICHFCLLKYVNIDFFLSFSQPAYVLKEVNACLKYKASCLVCSVWSSFLINYGFPVTLDDDPTMFFMSYLVWEGYM